jgi:hypothetical protein
VAPGIRNFGRCDRSGSDLGAGLNSVRRSLGVSMRPNPHEQKQEQIPSTLARTSSLRGVSLGQSDDSLRESLSPAHLAVLRAEGSYENIAAQLKIPVGTVRSRLSRARKALSELRASLLKEEQRSSAGAAFPLS